MMPENNSVNKRISIKGSKKYAELAKSYKTKRKMDLAISAMRKAINLDPQNPTLHEELLKTLLDMGKYDEAEVTCRQLMLFTPRNILALDVLGIVYLHMGKIDKALKITDELIQLDPTDAAHHFKKAVLLQQKGDISKAMSGFTKALEMDPGGEMAEDAREAIAALDSFQIRQILTLADGDKVFRTKLMLDPESASNEKGFKLSKGGINLLRQININELSDDNARRHYN